MNRLFRSSKNFTIPIKFIQYNLKNITSTASRRKAIDMTHLYSNNQSKSIITNQKKFFSDNNNSNNNNSNKNNKQDGEEVKKEDAKSKDKEEISTKANNESENVKENEDKASLAEKPRASSIKKKATVNLFLEEETNSLQDFVNLDKDSVEGENTQEKDEKEKEKATDKENLTKFPLIYNLVPIIPHSKLTLVNLHRNDLFFSLVMKYGRLNLIDEDRNCIEDIAVFFEKEEYSKSHILGTVCKVTYVNQEKLIVEGLDKMYSIKTDKLGKLKFFYPHENTLIRMDNENDSEETVDMSGAEAQLSHVQEIEALFKTIKADHDFLSEHLKISDDYFGEYDLTFGFDSVKIEEFISNKPSEQKVSSNTNNLSEVVEQGENNEMKINNFQNYLNELFKFSYFYILKLNTFSNLIYNHSEDFQNILHIRSLKKRLLKIKESMTGMISLIKLKHVFYDFPTDLKLNFENPFSKQTKLELNRILKYKEALDNKLSEVDSVEKQKEQFRKKIKEIVNMNEETKKVVEKEINKISNTNFETENGKRIEYINHIFALPWDTQDEPEWDLEYCKKTLDSNLYGLQETKERIYEFIAKNVRKNNKKGCVILLTGGPGTGKTRIAKLIGESLKRKVGFISLAGMSDGKGILGFKRTYISSTPGVLIKEMQKLGTKNPVIVIDEIDKVNYRSTQSNVYHALLQLLNIEENHRFIDHYLEIPFDFSNVIFILTSNNEDIFPPLMDRMEVIKVDPYIYYEKFLILKNFAQKQILNDYCYSEENFKITDQALYKLIYEYCKTEAGVRKAKKLLEKLVRKINAKIENEMESLESSLSPVDNKIGEEVNESSNILNNTANPLENKVIQINSNNLADILNIPKDEDPVLEDMILNSNRYGFCVGLFVSSTNQSNSWGSASIFSLSVREIKKLDAKRIDEAIPETSSVSKDTEAESNKNNKDSTENSDSDDKKTDKNDHSPAKDKSKKEDKKSKFKISSSGNLGEDSIQSLTIALNIATDMLNKLHPELADFFYKHEIHQHVPQVLLPKSGPSAGVVLFLCAISLALKKNIIPNLAMTGEVCIDGSVLKIGGVKEKAQGAQRYGIKTLVIPLSNKYDFLDLPDSLKNTFQKVYFAKNCQEIYNIGFGLDTSEVDCFTPPHSIQMNDFMNNEVFEQNNLVDLFFFNKTHNSEINDKI